MDEVRLSSGEFKALSSDTRLHIIRLLRERNHNITELSKKLGLSAPTVKQHLEVLAGSNIVMVIDNNRKWKYYCLTRKGKNLAEPAKASVFVVVGFAAVVVLAALLLFFVPMQAHYPYYSAGVGMNKMLAGEAIVNAPVPAAVDQNVSEQAVEKNEIVVEVLPFWDRLWIFVVIIIVAFLVAAVLMEKAVR